MTKILKRIASLRLLHFLVIGVVIFSIHTRYERYQQRVVNCLSQSQLDVLATDWARSTGRAVTPRELNRLAAVALDEHMLVKEAMLQGLHKSDAVITQRLLRDAEFLGVEGSVKNKIDAVLAMDVAVGDEVIRRRLIQVLQHSETLLEKNTHASQAELRAMYSNKTELGVVPLRISFEQLFFDSSKGDSRARANQALQNITLTDKDGDVFLDGRYFLNIGPVAMTSKFGEDFSLALSRADAPIGKWFGPLQSAYGFHLVRINEQQKAYRRSFVELAPELEDSWRQARQAQAWQLYIEHLRDRYRVKCHANN